MKTLLFVLAMTLSFSVIAGPYGNETVSYPPSPQVGPVGPQGPSKTAAIQSPIISHQPDRPDGEASGLTNIHYASFATIAALWGNGTCDEPVNSDLLKQIQVSCEGTLDESRVAQNQSGIICRYDPVSKKITLKNVRPLASFTLNRRGAISAINDVELATCKKLAEAFKGTPELCTLSTVIINQFPKATPSEQLEIISTCTRWAPGPVVSKVFAPFRHCAVKK